MLRQSGCVFGAETRWHLVGNQRAFCHIERMFSHYIELVFSNKCSAIA